MTQNDLQDLMKNWMEQQQSLWNGWLAQLQQARGGAGDDQAWAAGLEQWKQAVEQTLDTQKQATRAWAGRVAELDGAPGEMQRWAEEGVQLLDRWSEAQRGVWQQWFELMGQATPGSAPGRQMMAGWEQMTAQMQAFQRQWADAFVGAAGGRKNRKGGS